MNIVKTFFILAISAISASFASTEYHVDFTHPSIKTTENVKKVNIGPCTYYNYAYNHSWVLHGVASSYVEVVFDKPNWVQGKALLKLRHLASLVRGVPYSPVSIRVNNRMIHEHYDPACGDYVNDTFDITDAVIDGENVIRITLCHDATGNYWISNFAVVIEE